MKRRTSSRDDLFLSALDMYTLLSLVLIGLAFMSTRGQRDLKALELPTFEGESTSSTEEILSVRWHEGQRPRVAPNPSQLQESCTVAIFWPHRADRSQGAEAGGTELVTAPCYPRAFFGDAALRVESTQLAELRPRMGEDHPPVAILCDRQNKLGAEAAFECTCLQWIMTEAGFRIRALAAPP